MLGLKPLKTEYVPRRKRHATLAVQYGVSKMLKKKSNGKITALIKLMQFWSPTTTNIITY